MGSAISLQFQEVFRRAKSTGEDRALTLARGARLAVRVQNGVVKLTISRQGKPVGDTELTVFRRDCAVPADAERIPLTGQNERTDAGGLKWYFVAYIWKEQP